ncbi:MULTISPECIES: polyhydroxyalkanoate synthesis repressor PhaR [Methylocaldum]|jgi:polyhydroxyalkanoate synthesis repressor PhaR|uniref:polyhydroxyalkanoate synthesis repressor PhaR n=1 Tax=unclassified Methylocaldum TaxID=2622260 RepID=UPI00105DB5C4|nr:polyhydroxyalkanoate synthesis repressor PhaR [Methylocaldum sp. RMAD-M]MBP1150718.1 polyhydroxyalkanoate synthesis repressor PhaR [Methylocaldum sp. RMAD-M]
MSNAYNERIIKKYPNRRLYDTAISKYVTFGDIRGLVRDAIKFRVVDAKTDEDITRSTLLQLILEEEEKGQPIFTTEILEQIIRTYGNAMQGFMTAYLKESMDVFLKQQKLMQAQMANLIKNAPLSVFTELTRQNLKLWQTMQDGFFSAYGLDKASGTNDGKDEEKKRPYPLPEGEGTKGDSA